MPSPFLTPGTIAEADSLAVLHLRRNLLTPVILRSHDDENLGYDEGKVTNTRFGSFPHSTLIGQPWGSQVLASQVDTGSRGRRPQNESLKRKADEIETSEANEEIRPSQKAAVAASSGFIHLLPPTPESWTASLPHRTQVVYTPDYSYILHRLRVRPGSTIIEAGAGSGSFTHAAARATFNGYPSTAHPAKKQRLGKVCSFEFHQQRVGKIQQEIRDHGLEEVVEVNHRDVYSEGFLLGKPGAAESPRATAVFLDLPAPWLALKHLVRNPADGSPSPLDPTTPIYICTFSPCLEQVQQTISALRQHDWISISMVEISHRRIEVRREQFADEGARGRWAISGPKNVEDAVSKLRNIELKSQAFHSTKNQTDVDETPSNSKEHDQMHDGNDEEAETNVSAQAEEEPSSIPPYKQGTLIHRSEPDLKTHTSYLVFAILPVSWSEADEQRCREKWPLLEKPETTSGAQPKSKKQMKREAREARMQNERLRNAEKEEKQKAESAG